MDFSNLNSVDYVVIGITFFSTLFGFVRGFIGSFLSLVGWALSIYLSYALYPAIQPFIAAKMKNPMVAMIIGHTGLLLGFLVAFGVFNLFATTAVKGLTKGMIDRSLGAAFGVVRGGIIVSFVYFVLVTSISTFIGKKDTAKDGDALPKWVTSAQTYSMLVAGKGIVSDFIPDSFYKGIQDAYEQISAKSADERFMENITKKLRGSLDSDKLKELDQSAKDAEGSMSDEQLDNKKAQDLLDAFTDKQNSADSSSSSDIPNDDLQRLKNLLNKGGNNAPSDDTTPNPPAKVELQNE